MNKRQIEQIKIIQTNTVSNYKNEPPFTPLLKLKTVQI